MFFNIDAPVWGDGRVLAVKYQRGQEEHILRKLESQWKIMAPGFPFEYSFYAEELRMQYAQERSMSGLFTIFSGLSLFLALIGLIGLLSFSTDQRKKEISIRKVLGANLFQIFGLINRQYFLLLLLALGLAIPLSWKSMQSWLNSFAYSVNLSIPVYLVAGALVLILSTLSVSYLSLKIASTNPAKVLKDVDNI